MDCGHIYVPNHKTFSLIIWDPFWPIWTLSKIGQNSMKKWPFFAIILPWMASYGSETSCLIIFSAGDDLVKVSWKSDAWKCQKQVTSPYFDQLSERCQPLCQNRAKPAKKISKKDKTCQEISEKGKACQKILVRDNACQKISKKDNACPKNIKKWQGLPK